MVTADATLPAESNGRRGGELALSALFLLSGSLMGVLFGMPDDPASLLRSAASLALMTTGIALMFRWPWARRWAAGFFLLGSLMFVAVPLLVYLSAGDAPLTSLLVVSLFTGMLPTLIQAASNVGWIAAMVLVFLAVPSAVSWIIYRQLRLADRTARRPEIAVAAIAWALLLYGPALMDSHRSNEAANEEKRRQEHIHAYGLIQNLSIDNTGQWLAMSSDTGEIHTVDLTTQAVKRWDLSTLRIVGPAMVHLVGERIDAIVAPGHQWFISRWNGEGGKSGVLDANGQRLRDLALPDDAVVLGILAEDGDMLSFRRAHEQDGQWRLGTIDRVGQDGAVRFSVPATRSDRGQDEVELNVLPHAVNTGAMAPDREHYAYVHQGALHVVDTRTGKISIVGENLPEHTELRFSVEGDAVAAFATKRSADEALCRACSWISAAARS